MAKLNRRKGDGRRTLWGRICTAIQVFLILFLLTFLIGGGILAGTFAEMAKMLPDPRHLRGLAKAEGTRIYAQNGALLASLAIEQRVWTDVRDIPRHLINATIAVEDERFYDHPGMDLKGILRAAWIDLRHRSIVQGGSTITEQLAENIYLTHRQTLDRRLQEAVLALQIERLYSKEEILEFYLNEVYYGHGAYGAGAASKLYFDKSVKDLKEDLAGCALIAALPRSPLRFSPFQHPERARERRNLVLTKMANLGFISHAEAEQAKAEPLGVGPPRSFKPRRFRAPYFTTYVIDQLRKKHGFTSEMLHRGGFEVYTTLDIPIQIAAQDAVVNGLRQGEIRGKADQGALVCLDPRSGHVLALVGGRDFYDPNPANHPQWNRATQAPLQPGSSFKPVVYAVAMEKGWTPDSSISNAPLSFPGWVVHNYNNRYGGRVSLRTGLALSVNVAAVRLLKAVGVHDVIRYGHAMGYRSELEPHLAMALGSEEVTVLEHTSVFGCFANGGYRVEPAVIEKIVEYTGKIEYEHAHDPGDPAWPAKRVRVLSERSAAYMQEMLTGAVERGTGRRAKIGGVRCAGKTGTTSKCYDAWFIGFTPDLVAGVWVGNNLRKPMYKASGGYFCAPIWREFMTRATRIWQGQKRRQQDPEAPAQLVEQKPEAPPPSPHVWLRVCNESGLRATRYCPATHREKFARTEIPSSRCDVHTAPPDSSAEVIATVCRETGKLATPDCPSEERVFKAGVVPSERCDLHGRAAPEKPTPPRPSTPPPPAPPAAAAAEVGR